MKINPAAMPGDIVAQVSQSAKQEYYRIGRVKDMDYQSRTQQFIEPKYGYFFPPTQKNITWQMKKRLNAAMKSALVNEEIREEIMQQYLEWEKEQVKAIELAAAGIWVLLETIYADHPDSTRVTEKHGTYSVIVPTDNRDSFTEFSKEVFDFLFEQELLTQDFSSYLSSQRFYNYRSPEKKYLVRKNFTKVFSRKK